MRVHRLPYLFLWIASLAGCASAPGPVYSQWEAQSAWTVRNGTILELTPATIQEPLTDHGIIGGGVIGAALGSAVGEDSGARIAAAAGAVVGAAIGNQVQKAAASNPAWRILVQVEPSAESLVIVQPADQAFSAGEKVHVYTRADGAARVAKI